MATRIRDRRSEDIPTSSGFAIGNRAGDGFSEDVLVCASSGSAIIAAEIARATSRFIVILLTFCRSGFSAANLCVSVSPWLKVYLRSFHRVTPLNHRDTETQRFTQRVVLSGKAGGNRIIRPA